MKLKLIAMAALVALMTGCMSIPKTVKAMADSDRTIHIKVTSIYGVVEIAGTNPKTNQTSTVEDSGAISVTSHQPASDLPPEIVELLNRADQLNKKKKKK